jgi:hypothetical protein
LGGRPARGQDMFGQEILPEPPRPVVRLLL